ncbi:MAG: ferrous iron transport protein B [Caldilineales bacterium]|nr:ferrous iron transport protein B [Caldilineales bacterium]MDW8317157.1 ferrous iron transport protein B [Anaerolineae bacterium]
MPITVALAGNPNVGKSSIFNALTGSHQHVGNWPGKTVEKKEGRLRLNDRDILVVDLPGTYSLTAYSIEEIIARDYILNEHPTAVVAVIDASNLERNLYLVAQLVEMQVPVIIALNMVDIAASRGLKINGKRLSELLGGVPVVETVGNRSLGLDRLKEAIRQATDHPVQPSLPYRFRGVLGAEMDALEAQIRADKQLSGEYRPRWLAMKLLEADSAVLSVLELQGATELLEAARRARERVEAATGEDAETLIADQRYTFIGDLADAVLARPSQAVVTTSDKIDRVVTHRVWGLPIFLLAMWVVFQITANVSAPLLDWVDGFVNETLYGWATALLTAVGLGETWLAALVTDGVIVGVGGVLVFVPVLIFLYMALAVLEDSGYMARGAFVMDRVMRWMGLHGKSFLPMIVGFGCTVPAVYATRTLENERDRKLTGFLATFMSCGARLPVYVLVGTAFFGAASGNLVFAMYLLGIVVALATAFAFKRTVYKGKPPTPFVMELPPYRIPRPRDVWRSTWARTRSFLVKAGTIIFTVSVVLWLLMAIPASPGKGSFNDVAPEDSVFGLISGAAAPVFQPAGFGNWQAAGSLITGFLAKEVVVATMNQIYVGAEEATEEGGEAESAASFVDDAIGSVVGFVRALALTVQEAINIVPRTVNLIPGLEVPEVSFFGEAEEEESLTALQTALVASFNATAGSAQAGKVAAVAFTVFVLLYVPCMSATAAMRHEFGSRWMWAQVGFTLSLAWLAAVLVFQVGRLFV